MTMKQNLPAWINYEIANPSPEGGRNIQMFRLAANMSRCGLSEDEMSEIFREMYDLDVDDAEIESTIHSAMKCVSQEPYSRHGDEQCKLRRLENKAKAQLRSILRNYPWSWEELLEENLWRLDPAEQRRCFLSTLFEPNDIVWC